MPICLLTVYHVFTSGPDAPAADTFTMLWTACAGRVVVLAGSRVGITLFLGAGGLVCCAVLGFRSVVACSYCIGFCRPAAAADTTRCGIVGTGGVVAVGVHVEWGLRLRQYFVAPR